MSEINCSFWVGGNLSAFYGRPRLTIDPTFQTWLKFEINSIRGNLSNSKSPWINPLEGEGVSCVERLPLTPKKRWKLLIYMDLFIYILFNLM